MTELHYPLTPEILVPLIGDALLEKGLITRDQLKKGLRRQKDLKNQGQNLPLGQLLVEMGCLNRSDLDAAVTEQILALRAALQDANFNLECRVQARTTELQDALKKLAEINQLKTNFIANISHELRTPLTHIRGYLDLLLSHQLGDLFPDQEKALQVMLRSSDRLGRLIEDLIMFSSASRGEVAIQSAPVDLLRICHKVLQASAAKAENSKVSLEWSLPPTCRTVPADEEKITWVLLQLLDNAIKFTPQNKKISLHLDEEDEFVRISVIDEGIGIPENRQDEIFEPFHQLDGSSTRRFGGTGLGLALVRGIIEAHGSRIHVTSQVGQGSRFEFHLPSSHITEGPGG